MNQLPEEDSVVLSSICQTISTLTVDQVEDPESNFDFSGLRLDWARLQVSFFVNSLVLMQTQHSFYEVAFKFVNC